MSKYKRTSKKTGNYSRSTSTINSNGRVTKSNSTKPPGSGTRRTQSWNSQTGKIRETYTQKMGGGWTRRTSRTLNPTVKNSGPKNLSKNQRSLIVFLLMGIGWVTWKILQKMFHFFVFLCSGLGKIFRFLRNRPRK